MRALGETMNSMKLSAIALALGISVGIQEIDSVLKIADDFKYESDHRVYSQLTYDGMPKVVNGFPQISEDSDDLSLKIFRCGLAHYNYKIITLFIVALDSTQAKSMANMFYSKINIQAIREYPQNGDFKQHFFAEDISPDEVVNVGTSAEVVYTMFMANA